MNKKKHNNEAGYIAERKCPFNNDAKIVIYIASEQGVDVGTDKYVIICDDTSILCGSKNMKDARVLMKYPNNFCEKNCLKDKNKEK